MSDRLPPLNICHVVEAFMLMTPEEQAPLVARFREILEAVPDEDPWRSRITECQRRAPIVVWSFDHAPSALRDLSGGHDDEDWVAVIPDYTRPDWFDWLGAGSSFAPCDTIWATGPNHERIVIGVHS